MALCVTVNGLGQVVQATQPENPATCAYVLVSGGEYAGMVAPDFAQMGITAEAMTTVVLWGFGAMISAWALGLAGGWAAQSIKNAG